MRHAVFLGIVGGLVGLVAASCGSSGQCTAGQQLACACPDGTTGAQACNADGKGFGACQCTTSSSSSSGGTGGAHTSSSSGGGTGGTGTTSASSSGGGTGGTGTTSASSSGGGTGGMGTTSASSSGTGTGGAASSSSSSSASSTSGGPTCTPTWTKGFAASNQAVVSQTAVDASGNVVIAGSFLGTVDFGTGALSATGTGSSAFAAKYDCTGKPLWSKAFGMPTTTSDAVWAMALDPIGDILLTGTFSDTIDFGCGPLMAQGMYDGFAAKLDPTGQCVFSKRFGGSVAADIGSGIAADAAGNVFATGYFTGTTDFGSGPVTSNGSSPAIFLLKLGPTGSFSWVKLFGQVNSTPVLALDASANILLCGGGAGTIGSLDFGGGPLNTTDTLYLAKLDPNGGFVWNKSYAGGNLGTANCNAAAADASGNLVFGGTYTNTLIFGGTMLPQVQGFTNHGGFVAKVTAGGALVFATGNAGNAITSVNGVAVDGSGNVFAAGYFDTTVAFGGPTLTSVGKNDVFYVQLSPAGAFLSSKGFGDTNDQHGYAIAITPSGAPVLGGSYSGSIDFGGGMLPAATANNNAFLARL